MWRIILSVIAVLGITYAIQLYRSPRGPDAARLVPVVGAHEVLDLIKQGKHVVFVDAREDQEWQEEHIPGAINIPLRDVGKLDPKTLGNPDVVIAYCLKDFRGFEVAKALRNAGVKQASNLTEMGINGWKKTGLPTVVQNKRSEAQAGVQLIACAHGLTSCEGTKP